MGGRFRRHVFVCVNQRSASSEGGGGKPACGQRGGVEIAAALAIAAVSAPDQAWAATETGCLGPCFEGPNVVVYPEGCWYAGVRESDVGEIVREHLDGGREVERLRGTYSEDEA